MLKTVITGLLGIAIFAPPLAQANEPVRVEVCVYGATSAGVIAAVQAKRMGREVLLVATNSHIGGLTSGGLGFTDMGDERTVGGLSREYFHKVWEHYQTPEAWTVEPREKFRNKGQWGPAFNMELEIATVFEPHVAGDLFKELLKDEGIEMLTARIDLKDGVKMDGNRISAIRMESGEVVVADVFIDTTYEGDLMAKAGVSYTVGREANSVYGEKANGIQPGKKGNQLPAGIDPYVKAGDPSSGLLPRVNPDPGGKPGEGDKKIQAYCYRMCLTPAEENRVAITKPENYDEKDYEILFRAIEAGQKGRFFKFSALPNRKTDSNNDSGISTDYIGMNYDYPEADYGTRAKIEQAHKDWQLGLIWSLQNHPRVPEKMREAYAKWGLPKDEFTDNGHWSPQLYIREARRMVNDHVMHEKILLGRTVDQSIGMGSYKMDSHNTQLHVNEDGFISAEGDIQNNIRGPYEIDYRSIVPRENECSNLIVPVCVAASHIAYGSIRMESVFMILSQSAGAAASLAAEGKTSVQRISYEELKPVLEKSGQILHMPKGK